MRLDEVLERIRAGEYDPTVSGSVVEFYCPPEDHGVSPEPRDPAEAVATGARNPTYGSVLTEEETAFADRPTVERAMGAGWLLTNPIPTAIRTPESVKSSVAITQTSFEHLTDYKQQRGIDVRYGVDRDRAIWEVHSGWVIDVPDGYAVLYTHPLNYRPDAFRTIPGIVEEDQFPYMFWVPVVVDVESGNVQFDEPLAQIIPFERSGDATEADIAEIEADVTDLEGARAIDRDTAGTES